MQCAVCSVKFAVCCVQGLVFNFQFSEGSVNCSLCCLRCALVSVNSSAVSVQFAVFSVKSLLFAVQFKSSFS